jgi:diadenylate cyclase
VLAAMMASAISRLIALSWLIGKVLPALLGAVPVIFHPELRRALDRVGRTTIFASSRPNTHVEKAILVVSEAVLPLSQMKRGALIVFERNTGLEAYVETGVRLEAAVSSDLLVTIFTPTTPLHDGAVIIRDDRLVAAAIVLPLVEETTLNREEWLGTRHRAALGISQVTDAIAVVVSEETGTISVAHNGQLIRDLDKKRLEQLLIAFYKSQLGVVASSAWRRAGRAILVRLGVVKGVKQITPVQPHSKR